MTDEDNSSVKLAHRISPESGRDIQELRDFLTSLIEKEKNASDGDEISSALTKQYEAVLNDLPQYEIEDESKNDESNIDTYTPDPIESSGSARTYRINLHINSDFGDLISRVKSATQIMLNRVAAGQSQCFIRTALEHGLESRRRRQLNFPHILPYATRTPTTKEEIYAEEANVIEAAFHFPFSIAAPGIKLVIDSFKKAPNGRN